MARIIVLDSGPLGTACRRRGAPAVEEFTRWRIWMRAHGAVLVIPEIADYEVRRSLILAGPQGEAGLRRLNALHAEIAYAPISTAVMRTAAELWGRRSRPPLARPTADMKALDADVIVAAQALEYAGKTDDLTVATENVEHLSRYLDAQRWEDISD